MLPILPDLPTPLPSAGDAAQTEAVGAGTTRIIDTIKYPSRFGDIEGKTHEGLQAHLRSHLGKDAKRQQTDELQLPPLPAINPRRPITAFKLEVTAQSTTASMPVEAQLIYARRLITAALSHYTTDDFQRLFERASDARIKIMLVDLYQQATQKQDSHGRS